MEGTARIWFTPQQRAELWERWKNGQCVADIARALERRNKSGVYRILALNGGIAREPRRRAAGALRLKEREEISRGIAAGRSIRRIAQGLRRSHAVYFRHKDCCVFLLAQNMADWPSNIGGRPVHYRSSYVPDMLAGQVQVVFSPIPTTIQQVRAGKLRALVVTGATRSQALPDVPTIGEFLLGYQASVWNGAVAPKNTPGEIIDKLYKEIDTALADPEIMARFAEVGSVPKSMTPADFGKFIAEDTEMWAKVIQAAMIGAD